MGIELDGLFISGQGFLVSLSPVEQVTSFCMKDGTVRVENGMLVGRQSFFTAPEAAKHAAFGFRLLRGLLKSGALQGGDENGDTDVSISTFFRQCFEDGLLDLPGQVWIEMSGWVRILVLMFKAQRESAGGVERRASCKKFISNAAQSIEVASLTDGAFKLLWRHVKR